MPVEFLTDEQGCLRPVDRAAISTPMTWVLVLRRRSQQRLELRLPQAVGCGNCGMACELRVRMLVPVSSASSPHPVGCANSDVACELPILVNQGSVAWRFNHPTAEVTLMLSKLAYLTLCRSIQALVLLARGDAAKDLEVLVLRHQLAGAPPSGSTTQAGVGRPGAAGRGQSCPAPSPLVVLPGEARDAAALAPASCRRRMDLPAPPVRPATAGPACTTADRPAGQGKPDLGLLAHQGRAPPA